MTASHGGIWLSKDRQRQLAYYKQFLTDNFNHSLEWWEEDCDWCVPYVFFADEIREHGTAYKPVENYVAACNTANRCYAEFMTAFISNGR
jgi:hypothetical protein